MLKKILCFILSLFRKPVKQQEPKEVFIRDDEIKAKPKVEESIDDIENDDVPEDPIDYVDAEYDPKEEEASSEHIAEVSYKVITEEEKLSILDAIRPLIKEFNSDELYKNICANIAESRVLKTFSSLSEDGKELTIRLTQSNLFNNKIMDFITERVVSSFKFAIDFDTFGHYEINVNDGNIVLKKIG